LRLSRPRSSDSVELDGRQVRPRGFEQALPVPPFMGWGRFRPWFDEHWNAGDHVALVGMTKSGKTTLARSIIKLRDFCVVLGTKSRDPSLYAPLEAEGFVRVEKWDPWQWRETKQRYVIFAPPLELSDEPSPREVGEAVERQAEAFRTALIQIFKAGGWCVFADEVKYITDDLGLAREVNLLYLQGRSLGVTLVAATQRPRAVPLNVFEMAEWFFLWRITDREDRRRASEMVGVLAPTVFETAARLPRNEFVCVNKADDLAVRSRVQL
jgi:hypothetical protein